MLKAFDKTDLIEVLSYEDFIDKEHSFICPICKTEAIFVDAELKIKHFRHKTLSDCESEPESWEHIQMKKFFIDKLNLKKENIEVNLGFARPDLYIPEKRLAIEVQNSSLSSQKFIERTKNYRDNNIYVLWIFNIDFLKDWYETNVPLFLRKAHEIYYGQVYFIRWFDKNSNYSPHIIPVHFESIKTYVQEYEKAIYQDRDEWFLNGCETQYEIVGGYEKNLKIKKKIIFGNAIENLNIKTNINTWKNNNWKIGQFYSPIFWKIKREGKIYGDSRRQ